MTYQVLARKWRPRNFEEMVGQEHVLRALVNALDNDRLHHAFLFTGTRGVGKTTIARILAKSLNCEQGVSSKPCGECATCREIDEGRFVDLIEVDAASRTKVDETRELLDNVQYAPTRGRYKVYLIDEVHMFSASSFNALLKTLEEPPPHVKFLLATTDPQKLPVTILSRCLQFNLRRLPLAQIEGQFRRILEAEGIEHEPAALKRLARAADGSMRDGLSLLDQAIAFGGGAVREAEVQAMLGTIEQDGVLRLLEALADGNGKAVLDVVADLAERAPDFEDVLAELNGTLHHLALIQQVPEAADESMGDLERLQALASRITPEELQLWYQIGITGRRDLPLAPDPRSGLEMVLLRMLAFRPADAGAPAAATPPPGQAATAPRKPPAEPRPATGAPAATTAQTRAPPVAEAAPAAPAAVATDWHAIAAALPVSGLLRQLVNQCVMESLEGDRISLALDPAGAPLLTKEREAALVKALSDHFGRPMKLSIEARAATGETPADRDARLAAERQAQAEQAILGDPNVQSIIETFDAQVRPGSVQALDGND